ncbi:MAG: TIM barrel protein, partial [Bacillota bacterium]|nr:TIM barrel protein [Bacillota bacterium]
MKTSIVVADGTFPTNTAALLGSFDFVAARASEIGFDAMQLTVNNPAEVDLCALQHAMVKHGISVSSIATGRGYTVDGLCLASGDPYNRKAAVQRMKEHMDLGAEIGFEKAFIGAFRGWTKDAGGSQSYLHAIRESLFVLVDYGEKKNVDIVFLSDIPATALSKPQFRTLDDFVRNRGGALFLSGGIRSFASGEYPGSDLESILPVRSDYTPDRNEGGTAICFLIDRSGSMKGEKLSFAKSAVTEAMTLLSGKDRVGIIAFDQNPEVVVP